MYPRPQFYFSEGDTATIDVLRLGTCSHEVLVEYETFGSEGTADYDAAEAGSDFALASGTIAFAPG